ncbi:inner membrane,YgjV-like protein [Pasteurella multocida]|nr:inner membrane,YgjV-like protein [Pasteurella multocida]
MEVNAVELLGYVATFFVAISFLFKSIIHLRIVNSIGAFLFAIYGLIIVSYPVALLNSFFVVCKYLSTMALEKRRSKPSFFIKK